MKKRIFLLGLFLCIFITGCSPNEREVIGEEISSGYNEIIVNNKIVNPQAVINSFNEDIDRALEFFNGETLAIKVFPQDITEGSFIFPNKNGESVVIDGLYARFLEDTESETKTNLVCSIRSDDAYLLEYASDGVYDTNGNLLKAPTVDAFYLIGSIYSAVGSVNYNILMKDCLLVPVKNISTIEVPNVIEDVSEVVDFVSGENISVFENEYYWGTFDLNEDGLTDVLNITTKTLKPVSSFEKIVQSNILENLSLKLESSFVAGYDEKYSGFSLPYPLAFGKIDINTSSSFDGSNLVIANVGILGKDKREINYSENRAKIDKVFSDIALNDFYLENQNYLFSINKDYIGPFNIKMLNGEETSSVASDKILIRRYDLSPYGKLSGEIYVKADYPFEHCYVSDLKMITADIIEEVSLENRVFYDKEIFKETGQFEKNKKELEVKEEIVIGDRAKKIINYTITSRPDNPIQYGNGTSEDGNIVNVIKLSKGDHLLITDIIKEEDSYWLVVKSGNFNGYIPISFDKDITSKDSKIKILGTNFLFNDVFIR